MLQQNDSEQNGQNEVNLTRREFVKAATVAGAAMAGAETFLGGMPAGAARKAKASASTSTAATSAPSSGKKTRYALVGVGGRSKMYRDAIDGPYAQWHELVAYCDNNLGRLELAQRLTAEKTGRKPALYDVAKDPSQFERMIREAKPDIVIVTTPCGLHHDYICRALEAGVEVISEKAMTTEPAKCQRILDTLRRTGRKCRVTFNCRYMPACAQAKEVLLSGAIGDILSVDFHWMLDTTHGADYFRRWHSHKVNSGGLMIHKASHHFDLMNWWLSAIPTEVFATGKREFYTPKTAGRLGLGGPQERCLTCTNAAKCAFAIDLRDKEFKALYLDNEKYDGYFRDRCIFREDIDIEDTMNVLAKYDSGVTMAYSLNAFAAWEGYVATFNGTKGRMEFKVEEAVSLFGDGSVPSAVKPEGTYIKIYPIRKPAYMVEMKEGKGAHGGGDEIMLADLFLPEPPADTLLRRADHRSGAYGMLIGAAANISFKTGERVEIAKLVAGLDYPDYPKMPGHDEPIPMPETKARTV